MFIGNTCRFEFVSKFSIKDFLEEILETTVIFFQDRITSYNVCYTKLLRKEDQGQNTCIFSIEFALKMMGDIQEFFIKNRVRNFYSVSVSGYHIAEAGAT